MAYFEDTRVALYIGPAFLVLLTVLYYAFRLAPKSTRCGNRPLPDEVGRARPGPQAATSLCGSKLSARASCHIRE
jgi:hypothetical protein